jgi:hypothetical protein
MRPLYGSLNDKGQWFDGKDWRSWADSKSEDFEKKVAQETFRIWETLKRHDEKNCHVDGIFECPRCRYKHYIPDNFELLCDGCVSVIEEHPNASPEQLSGIALWKIKARLGRADLDIAEMYQKRDELMNS